MTTSLMIYIAMTVALILGTAAGFTYMASDLCAAYERDTKVRARKRRKYMMFFFPFILIVVTGFMAPVIQIILKHLGVE